MQQYYAKSNNKEYILVNPTACFNVDVFYINNKYLTVYVS